MLALYACKPVSPRLDHYKYQNLTLKVHSVAGCTSANAVVDEQAEENLEWVMCKTFERHCTVMLKEVSWKINDNAATEFLQFLYATFGTVEQLLQIALSGETLSIETISIFDPHHCLSFFVDFIK